MIENCLIFFESEVSDEVLVNLKGDWGTDFIGDFIGECGTDFIGECGTDFIGDWGIDFIGDWGITLVSSGSCLTLVRGKSMKGFFCSSCFGFSSTLEGKALRDASKVSTKARE